jgi:hypothetical protein
MPNIRPTLDRIDAALRDHETGGVFGDDLSGDAMRWTTDADAVPAEAASDWGEVISAYSRADAIADGELVDVSAMAREAGIRLPVAVTRAVWEDCVAWDDADSERKGWPQDQDGRLWDVLHMTRAAILRTPSGVTDRVRVQLFRVPRTGGGVQPRLVELVAVCGPGDNAEPVITIQMPGED